MYKLKQTPEDFIVKELPKLTIREEGKFSYFTMLKRNYNTIDAISAVGKHFKIPQKKIGFAGTKDKKAITYQAISVPGRFSKNVEINKDLKLILLGFGNEPISLGDLEGNAFIINIRNVEKYEISKSDKMPNYFDEQRFSKNNVEIGLNILRGNFKEAVNLIDDRFANKYLETHKNDFVGAFKKIPFKIQRLFVHSFQSFLFNELLRKKIKGRKVEYSQGELTFDESYGKIEDLPLVGFSTKNTQVIELLQSYNLTVRDFIVRPHPDLSCEGESRESIVKIENIILKESSDELNEGKKKINLMFNLPKGSYATIAIKQLLKTVQ